MSSKQYIDNEYELYDSEEEENSVTYSNGTVTYDYYDEMNDLDAVYKEIHSAGNEFDIFISILYAILRPLIAFVIIFIAIVIALQFGTKQNAEIGQDIFTHSLKLISSMFSHSFFMHNNMNNNNNNFVSP